MPCGHGSTSGNIEKVADSRSCNQSKRSLDENNHKVCPNDAQVSALVLRNSEERCIIFTLVMLGLDAPLRFLAPFLLNVQRSNCRNYLGPGNIDRLDASSTQPVMIFRVDRQKEKGINSPKNTCAAKSFSGRSSGQNTLGHSRSRNKRTKSIRSSSASSVNSPQSDISSVPVSDNLSALHPDFVIPNSLNAENPSVKKSTRKKGKKKRKQYKQSLCKKVSIESGSPCAEGISDASVDDAFVKSDLAGLGESSSGNNLPESATLSTLSIQDIVMEKADTRVNSACSIQSSSGSMACISSLAEMDSTEPIASSLRSAVEGSSCNKLSIDDISTDLTNTSCNVHYQETILPASDDKYTSSYAEQECLSCGIYHRNSLDQSICTAEDSTLDSWNSDLSEFVSDDTDARSSITDGTACHSVFLHSCDINSETSTDCCLSSSEARDRSTKGNNNNNNNNNSTEIVQCSSQATSSDDFYPVVNRKRGKLLRKMAGSSNTGNIFSSANTLGRTRKEITRKEIKYPVWQKVQKHGTEECNHNLRAKSDTFMGSKQSQNDKSIISPCSNEMVVQAESQAATSKSNDSIWKPISISKQSNDYSRKGSYSHKKNIARPSKIQIQQKDVCCQSEQLQEREPCMESTPLGYGCSTVNVMTSLDQTEVSLPADDHKCKILPILDLSSETGSNVIKQYDNMHVDNHSTDIEDDGSMKSEAESSIVEHSKLSNCSGSLMQKWIPVRRKDPVADETDKAISDNLNAKNVEAEVLSSNSDHSILFTSGSSECSSPSSEDPDCQSPETDELSSEFKTLPHNREKLSDLLPVSNCHLTHEVKNKYMFQVKDHLDVIIRAVADAYKSQIASESAYLVTGSSIAEFEKLLHSASPILGQIDCSSCEACSQIQIGNSLCLHHIPNFSLTSLWQWFERPGSYGLEVKVDDYNNSKMLRTGQFEFCAYFVPSLSAMQLFGWAKNSCSGDGGSSNGELREAARVAINSSSHLSSLSIISKLPPQSHKQVDINDIGSSSSANEDLCEGSIAGHLGNEELLFEYFESDQPQQRRPLYEKIKELVRGDVAANDKMFGDPLNLECLNLHDLHPASWYCVAWYPIYRIPDGNFRAAFLTYHSLGHFAYRKTSPSGAACLVSPVVGLQSYNAKGECWFQPHPLKSPMVQTEKTFTLDPSQILNERLRALEWTASVMARASVWKGNQISVNRQPDYEFFTSRRR